MFVVSKLRVLAEATRGRDNNLNLLRMVAASAVLLSHSYPIALGPGTLEPAFVKGVSLGGFAVLIFFSLSGFLVTRSYRRSGSVIDFVSARAFRLLPGLAVMLLLAALVIGPIVSPLPVQSYFADRDVFRFITVNLTFRGYYPQLPEVFSRNIYPDAVNGSLWTLQYEVRCYLLVMVSGLLRLLTPARFWIVLVICTVCYVRAQAGDAGTIPASNLSLLAPAFVIGMALAVYDRALPFSPLFVILLALAVALAHQTPLYFLLLSLTIAYGTIVFGYLRIPILLKYNRLGDYSYGMYIYAFLVQQLIMFVLADESIFVLTLLAIPTTLVLSVLSWEFVEAPAMKLRLYLMLRWNKRHPAAT